MTEQPSKSKHHHGDLRRALVDAGLSLLEEGGLEALTLRKCAARAGVSHAAPAHHFDGLQGLKEAIAEEGFEIFTSYLVKHTTGHTSDRARLKGLGAGYIQFGLDHPGLLKVIFGAGLASLSPYQREEAPGYLLLREVCAPFVAEGRSPQSVELGFWSLVHGFTLLCVEGEFGSPPPAIKDGPAEQVLALLDNI